MSELPHHRLRRYDFRLPVLFPGDRLSELLKTGDAKAAFVALSSQYEEAAARCREMAEVAGNCPELTVQASGVYIGVRGPSEKLDTYLKGGVITVPEREEFDRRATERLLLERLWEIMTGKGPFSVEQLVEELAKTDRDLRGLNPSWVRAMLDKLVEKEMLKRSGDLYEAEPDY